MMHAAVRDTPDETAGRAEWIEWVLEVRGLLQLFGPEERAEILREMPRRVQRKLATDPRFHARPKQLQVLQSEADTVMALAGRGWGKNWVGAHWLLEKARSGKHANLALVGETAADVRDYMVEGPSGILRLAPPDFQPDYQPSKRRVTFPNGAKATTYSGDKPGQLRGFSGSIMWLDELAKYKYAAEVEDQIGYTLREGEEQQLLVTTTPRPIDIIQEMAGDDAVDTVTGSSFENEAHLGDRMMRKIEGVEGTRLGRQEVYAEIIDANPGALWSHDDFRHIETAPDLKRIVVGVDPSGGGDEIGIVTAGVANDGRAYVLSDRTTEGSPNAWAKAVQAAYEQHEADLIVAEKNFGGDMVASNIQSVDGALPVEMVHASRGKQQRAEPIHNLYEQGRVLHVGALPTLEDEQTQWDPEESEWSPNRLDAAVWALTELVLDADRTEEAFGSILSAN
jgi:phage terminase large subunit-like protein